MSKKFSSIVEELANYAPPKDCDLFVESRAQQVIASATHLIKLIEQSYDAETADDLRRRLINSIRSGDENKFRRKISQIRSSKKKG